MNEIEIDIAKMAVAKSPAVLVAKSLGSCVALSLYDLAVRVGAMARVVGDMDLIMLLKDYQTLIIGIITLIALIVGLTLTYRQLVSMKKDRHSELVMNLNSIFDSELIYESRKAIKEIKNRNGCLCNKLKEYERSDPEKYFILIRVGDFFEHMGWLVDKGYIEDSILITDLFGGAIINYYKLYEEFVSKEREEHPHLYKYFEKLKEMATEGY